MAYKFDTTGFAPGEGPHGFTLTCLTCGDVLHFTVHATLEAVEQARDAHGCDPARLGDLQEEQWQLRS